MPDLTINAAGGPVCSACGSAAVVQWRRRPTVAELAELTAAQVPDATRAVYACGAHAISVDLAAHVHAAECTAPDAKNLPGCDCTPEPIPVVAAPMDQPTVTLPTGWTIPTP